MDQDTRSIFPMKGEEMNHYGNSNHRSLNSSISYQDLISDRVAIGRNIYCSGRCSNRAGPNNKRGLLVATVKRNTACAECPECGSAQIFTEIVYSQRKTKV